MWKTQVKKEEQEMFILPNICDSEKWKNPAQLHWVFIKEWSETKDEKPQNNYKAIIISVKDRTVLYNIKYEALDYRKQAIC